jgi:hypothetical protein
MRLNLITLGCAIMLAVGLSLGVGAGPIVDDDGDGVINELDNCSNVRNAEQCDADLDGYGNGCDADYDQNQAAGISDFSTFSNSFAGPGPNGEDHDCNGVVGISDFSTFGAQFGLPPGPSGLLCAGTVACSGI